VIRANSDSRFPLALGAYLIYTICFSHKENNMPSRSSLTKAERERRSRLAQLIRSRGVLRGSLVEMNRTCGIA